MKLLTAVLLLVPTVALAAGEPKPRVRLETNKGVIVLELDSAKAPKTVANFLQYVRDKYYDGLIFHRVIKGFMIQGGGVTIDYRPKATRPPVVNEAGNGLKNLKGTVAMARTGEVNSATGQFFINHKDNDFLDHRDDTPEGFGYCVFGKVVEGMDVVNAIADIPTGPGGPFGSDVPTAPVMIMKATVVGGDKPTATK
jgi:cyclophilin family peptidyl-prolyl cis-trans isomerase